jgi:hypothetical protein
VNNLVLNATRVARHSRRYFLVLCGWCDGELGAVGAAVAVCACDRQGELLRGGQRCLERLGQFCEPVTRSRHARWRGRHQVATRVRGPVAVG